MDDILNEIEIRVLGSLIEKEKTTPEYYPLSLNALTNACNQKSNRDPVVSYDETTVIQAIDSLTDKKFAWRSDASRVTKYNQNFVKSKNLIDKEAALLCLLFLRGPQTIGELRGRSERLYRFEDMDEVKETLESLAEMEMVTQLPKMPGRKEARYAHLLSGEPETTQDYRIHFEVNQSQGTQETTRIENLENDIILLREELNELRKEFTEFKKMFE